MTNARDKRGHDDSIYRYRLVMMMRVLVVAQPADESPKRQRERADNSELHTHVKRQAQAKVIGERRNRKSEEYADDEPHLFQVRSE
jgi:hypothetical protein